MSFPCPHWDSTQLPDCSGCTDRNSEGTHQGCTKQHGHVGCDLSDPTGIIPASSVQTPIQLPPLPETRRHRYVSRKFLLEHANVAEKVDEFLNGFHIPGVMEALYNWRIVGYVPGVAGEIVITVHVFDARDTYYGDTTTPKR